jgi:hypothetical protein
MYSDQFETVPEQHVCSEVRADDARDIPAHHAVPSETPGRGPIDCAFFNRPGTKAISNVPGRSGLPPQAALSAAMRCAVDTSTAKVSRVGGDSKTDLNAALIVS